MVASNYLKQVDSWNSRTYYTQYLAFVVCFDIQTQRCTILKNFFFKTDSATLCIDSDGVMYVQNEKNCYRFPLRFVLKEKLKMFTFLFFY